MSGTGWKLAAVFVVFIAFMVNNVLDSVRPFKAPLATNDDATNKCKLVEGPTGAEDMVLTKYNGWIITSSVDAGHSIDEGIDACERDSGGLFAFQLDANSKAFRIQIKGMPNDVKSCFQTHGLFLSNTTDRLYAVTHHGNYSSIEIFDVAYNNQEPPTLEWVRSVTSPSFLNGAPNDVVEGTSAGELYVTQWLPFAVPIKGRFHASSFMEKLQQALLVPIFILGLKLTTVHHCTFTDDLPAKCTIATPTRFRVANGITISSDRNTVFVNDVLSYSIVVFQRQDESGMLQQTDKIKLTHAVDNIEYKQSENGKEEIWMGTIPDMMLVASNEEKPFPERTIVPGGLAVVAKEDDDDTWGEQHVVYNHDGSMLSQVSFGMAHNNKIVLGSAYAKGILVCDP